MLYRSIAQMLSQSTALVGLVRLQASWRFIKTVINGNYDRAFAYDLTSKDGDLLDIQRLELKMLRRR
uniref:hypothetical protein n=1 Tax=Pannonibacter phragmitetus TaxID=121719 RepID=UPI000B96C9EB|nr:hypothetical protein [Pannonibacter phragmitetus]